MRSLTMLAAVAALSLSACMGSTSGAPPGSAGVVPAIGTVADAVNAPAPVVAADRTTLDESAGIAFETAVTVAADLATLAVRTNRVPVARLPELRERVAWARVAVGAVRAAYDTGNATSYRAAIASAKCAIDRIRTLATGAADQACPAANSGGVR